MCVYVSMLCASNCAHTWRASYVLLCYALPSSFEAGSLSELGTCVLGGKAGSQQILFLHPPQRWITDLHRTTLCLFYGCWIQTPVLMPEQQALLMDELPFWPLCISFDLRYFIFDFCSISWFILATFPLVFWNNIYLFLLLWLCGFISEGSLFFAVLYCFLNIFPVSHTMGPWLFKTKSVSRIIIFHPHSRSFPLHFCFSCLPTLTHNDYLFKH